VPRISVTLSELLSWFRWPEGASDRIMAKLNRLEEILSDLTESIDALKAAVDGVAQRMLPNVEALEAALAATQAQLAVALADDAAAAEVLADSNAATAAIRVEVDRLNALGTAPATPVDPDPADPVDPPVVIDQPAPVE
jgi:predicted component of type VI protein secretion system